MSPDSKINVLIVHGDPLTAAGLTAVLSDQGDLEVRVGRPTPVGPSDIDAGVDGGVHVVVADYGSGVGFLGNARFSMNRPPVTTPKIMVVTDLDREWEIRSAMNAGVHGYVLQGCPLEELVNGVRTLGQGSRFLCSAAANCIADSLTRRALTGRETDVLRLLSRGSGNKAIARDLGIEPGTVKAHVKGILAKLKATTRTQAVAMRRGMVTSNSLETDL